MRCRLLCPNVAQQLDLQRRLVTPEAFPHRSRKKTWPSVYVMLNTKLSSNPLATTHKTCGSVTLFAQKFDELMNNHYTFQHGGKRSPRGKFAYRRRLAHDTAYFDWLLMCYESPILLFSWRSKNLPVSSLTVGLHCVWTLMALQALRTPHGICRGLIRS